VLLWLNSPHFIGTMNPTRKPSNADLQLRQSFRWVLLSPSLEPVSGLLSRHLRHALTQLPREVGAEKTEALRRVLEWLPTVWEHLNKALSQSACIGEWSYLMHCIHFGNSFSVWLKDTMKVWILINVSLVSLLLVYGASVCWELI